MASIPRVGYVASDKGPRLTLGAVAACLPGTWLAEGADVKRWVGALQQRNIELLFCGTSDTANGQAEEAAARIAVNSLHGRCIVVEDFPGNYAEVAGGSPTVLCVESEFAARRAWSREKGLDIEFVPSVRYDSQRSRLTELRRGSVGKDAVLWVGQPETRDSLETLKRLLPALRKRGTAVWFRAHPRDDGYARGDYAPLGLRDLTTSPLEDCLAQRPTAILTQFSSVAIEAGFWGIPAVNVLFADLGGRTLEAKKGYAVPPWCEQGAAFLIVHEADVEKVLDQALDSPEARAQALEAFDRYHRVVENGAQKLLNVLYNRGFLIYQAP
jgi:hypothetical protein